MRKRPHIFVVGNEKGGVGKTTCCMHLIASLLDQGLKVASIDVDSRQKSITAYVENRKKYNKLNPDKLVPEPLHFVVSESSVSSVHEKEQEERSNFERMFNEAIAHADVIVIDTPGSYSFLSRLAHSHADTVITPINDSFVDIDVLAKVDSSTYKVIGPSIYSEMIWRQKLERAQRDGKSIDWILVKNRQSNLETLNKRNVQVVLDELAKRISFKVIPGFGERVIFRELFLHGLTLLDLGKANYNKPFTASNVAARQELREFMKELNAATTYLSA